MKFRMAVFDLAGTTVTDHDYVATAFQHAFLTQGVDVTVDEVNPLMGFRKTDAISEILKRRGLAAGQTAVDAIHAGFVTAMTGFYAESADVAPMEGAEDVFRHLHGLGIRVALNSGFPKVIVDTIVHRFEWLVEGLVDDCIASDEVERGRPFPFMIAELMRRAGIVASKEVVKVGDTVVDIQEGRMAGCGLVIGVTTGAFGKAALESFSPDIVVASLDELKTILS